MTLSFPPADVRLCGAQTELVILVLHRKHDYRLS